MFVLTLQGLRTYQCGFVIQQRQCSSLFRQFPLAMTSSANVELPSAWSKCQCVLMSQRRLMKRRSNCTAYLRGARDIASVDPPAPAKEKTFGGISDTVKGVLWYGPRESRDMRHTGSHLARTGSRLCPLSSCASQNVL